jgi:CHAT domain-containing protein/TolA-binding protein
MPAVRIIACCALLSGVVGIARADTTAGPEDVVREIVNARANGDERRALALVSESAAPGVREELTEDIRLRCLELLSYQVTASESKGDRANVDVTAVIARTPRGKGKRVVDIERRRFDLKREAGGWRVEAMPTAEQQLALQIASAPNAAKELLAAHTELIDPQLVTQLVEAATSGGRDSAPIQRPLADLAYEIALAIDDRAGRAEAIAAQIRQENVPGANRRALIPRAELAYKLARESEEPRAIAAAGSVLAILHLSGDPTSREGARIYQEILEYRQALRPNRVAGILSNIGMSLVARQEYSAAYQALSEAISLSKEGATISRAENYLGRILEVQNDPALALEHFRRAAQAQGSKPLTIEAHLSMVRALRALNRQDEAWTEIETVGKLALGTPFKGLISQYYVMRTELQIDRGEMAGAEETLQKAIVFAREARGDVLEMDALLSLGNVYYSTGRFAEALRTARDAEAVWRKFDFPGYKRYPALMLAARSELALGHEEPATAGFTEAIAAVESAREAVAGDERQRIRFFEPYNAAFTEMVDLLVTRGRVAEGLVYAERGKGRVLLDVLGQQRNDGAGLLSAEERAGREALVAGLGAINRKVIVLGATEGSSGSALEKLRDQQRRAQSALDAFDGELAARHPRLRAARAETAIIDPASPLEISPDLVFLEFVVHERRTHLFVVDRSSVTHHRIEITRAALRERVTAFSQRLASRDLDYRDSARALYDLLLAPAANRLKGKRIHCVVPDDVLWRLPFEALIAGDGRFVIERAAVFYAPSISIHQEIVRAQRRRQRGEITLVAFGNPSLTGGARPRPASAVRGVDLGPLPDAEDEVRAIARLYGPRSRVYVRGDANEANAKREMPRAAVVHFATHGLFDERNPMFSQIVLASAGEEDGVLQAWEIMRLDLATDLVVLSACDTAGGEGRAGEGLIGMSWALFAGGCPSTVATHWRVDSPSASRLMVGFHRHLVRGGRARGAVKAEALRAAQLELLRDAATRHPFYWAGFVLIGSERD